MNFKLLHISFPKNNLQSSIYNIQLFIRRNLLLLFISFALLLAPSLSRADDFPARSNTLVTDYTNTLNQNELISLEQKLVAFNDSTSTQIAVVIMQSVGGYDISDYSTQLFNKWGIGDQKKNNGVLILVAKQDHKIFINTGRGIEGVLPDVLCKRIITNDIQPNFRAGDYYGGLDQATNSIMSIVKGEFTADSYMKRGARNGQDSQGWFFLFLFGFILFVVIFSKVARTRKYALTNHIGFWAAWALLSAVSRRSSSGSWGGFSGGSSFGGGGFGGGGGGFGGFGGGMSGGGGAGGSW